MNYGLGKGVVWTCCCFLTPILNGLTVIRAVIGSSSNDDGNVNENSKKSSRLRLAKQWLCMCLTYFCTFFCHRPRCKNANFTSVEDMNIRPWPSLSFPELRFSLLEFNSRKIVNIWRTKQDEISAIWFEAVKLHYLSYIFIAVTIIVTYAPSC